jgi:hypothetical protein
VDSLIVKLNIPSLVTDTAPTSPSEGSTPTPMPVGSPPMLLSSPITTSGEHSLATSPTQSLPHYNTNNIPQSAAIISGETATSAPKDESTGTMPKKILHFNIRTGTIGSPPLKKTSGRKSGGKTKVENLPKTLVVRLKYGPKSQSGILMKESIVHILDGTVTLASLKKELKSSLAPSKTKPPKSSKSTHPFFLGKVVPKEVPVEVQDAPSTISPKPKKSMTMAEAMAHSPVRNTIEIIKKPSYFSKAPKLAGAVEPCWPPLGMVHVRGYELLPRNIEAPEDALSTVKKCKYMSTDAVLGEDILHTVAARLNIEDVLAEIRRFDPDEFIQPPRCLRVPEKHFESGVKIQRRIRRQLSVPLPSPSNGSSSDEIQGDQRRHKANPAVLKVYHGIPTSLTAFDKGQCETLPWIHKYAPVTAAEVLQPGREAFILKDWLQALTVLSVEKAAVVQEGNGVPSRKSTGAKAEKPEKPKKKRKSDKLEGFVISTDEENDLMDEIPEPDEPSLSQRSLNKKSVIRTGDLCAKTGERLKNAVVLSGPMGCGKTAMVYAVAKELDFEVFEINSSSRRSGKEIMERVGDMTRNHLVHQGPQATHRDADAERIASAFDADLQSGRQGTMASFFKPKTANPKTSPNGKKKKEETSPNGKKKKEETAAPPKKTKAPPKAQKQSLILLEEVDVLFKEDREFWATVMGLIATSKRPIIMTCNDETVVPLLALPLHAILRLTAPPLDLAVDYMLVVAASEGHVLKRKAIEALYEARDHDLRASLMELNYWCQIGVGAIKGGVEWFYPRWPRDCDLDEHGDTIRVVSEGTYKVGMGWLGRDCAFDSAIDSSLEEQVLHKAWDNWGIDASELRSDLECPYQVPDIHNLSDYESFTATMSDADICSHGSLSTDNHVHVDTSTPPLPTKSRDDYITAHPLLEADPLTTYSPTQKSIAMFLKSSARRHLSSSLSAFKDISEPHIRQQVFSRRDREEELVTRNDFSLAFDPIAAPTPTTNFSSSSSSSLDPSVFDRPLPLIALDVAPYVRSILAYDAKLAARRAQMSGLLSVGGGRDGRRAKKQRTTRAALSALEGAGTTRKSVRPEKWFVADLNGVFVRRTAGEGWAEAVGEVVKRGKDKGSEMVVSGGSSE